MRLTKLAARLYPRWWRERYGEEFAALLEDARPGWRGAVDIAGGAIAMQMTQPLSAKRIWLLLSLLGLLLGSALTLATRPQYRAAVYVTVPRPSAESRRRLEQAVGLRLGQEMRKVSIRSQDDAPGTLELVVYDRDQPVADHLSMEMMHAALDVSGGLNLIALGRAPAEPKPPLPLVPYSWAGTISGIVTGAFVGLAVYARRLRRKVAKLSGAAKEA